MTAREELVRAIGEAILAEARKWPHVPGDRYGARLAPMGATEVDLGRAALAVIDAAGWRPMASDSEIRALLDAYYDPAADVGTEVNVVARTTRILDSARPAPGPGCYPPVDGWDGVAIPTPDPDDQAHDSEDRHERQAAVDRAHAALGGPSLTTDAELRALTPDQLEKCVHRALKAGDVQAVEGYLLLMALKDPHRAQDLIDTFKVGLQLAKEQQP